MFILFLIRFGLLSGHLLGISCSLGLPYVLFVFLNICNFSYFPFWFEGWIWVLIDSILEVFAYVLLSDDDITKTRPYNVLGLFTAVKMRTLE